MNKKATIFLVLILLWQTAIQSQPLLTLAPEVYKSYQELKGAFENIDKVQSIVKDIEKGNKPNVASYGSNWAPLANSYKQAAESIKNAKLVTDFNAAVYSVSIGELSNCYIKDQTFAKLRNYQSQLDAAVARGQKELADIADYKKLIDQTFTALNYLIEVNKKLLSVPIYNEIFQWNWFDLDQGVHPALGELSSAINAHERKVKQEIEKIKNQSSNLRSNTTMLNNSLCILTGIYRGTGTDQFGPHQYTLSVTGNTNRYFAQISVVNAHGTRIWSNSAMNLSNNRDLAFTTTSQGATLTFRGTLASNYRVIQNFHWDGSKYGSFSLSK